MLNFLCGWFHAVLPMASWNYCHQFGNDMPFTSAFQLSRLEYKPKGILKIVKGGESA